MNIYKDLTVAKNQAIETTMRCVTECFVIAWVLALGLPPLFTLALGDSASDAKKTAATIFISAASSLVFRQFSFSRVEKTVGNAIDAAVKQESKARSQRQESKRQTINRDPDIRLKIQRQEYACLIPDRHRSQEAKSIGVLRESSVCSALTGRNAVIRSLSHDKETLKDIAAIAAEETLQEFGQYKEQSFDVLWRDIYIYLQGWLMISISHNRPMPIGYIQKNYPTCERPNVKVYVEAIKIAQEQLVDHPETIKKMKDFLSSQEIKDARQVIRVYLDDLINELEKEIY